ncbi:hypothetical protein EHW99_0588 [Erwinia amylovora]|uniref:Uncharacterized protein n=3 Tax=Erwinia amylovora TaxID=552 RepID=A0A831A7B6_ERWAM|nr:hypothetical protein EaACW_3043 [Erwinia amylovora ACW56400]QJQ53295.1 hypothetical protein EHX00_0588 [Erwinia amylovora]CBA22861.1 hypothetical protein predicted by Glimmer/Critica [Erwinia amylovora CFBP1430]CBX81911.1 hypothetical protein predicted by Glimmer/Critica [Erwinia amylovora ATCC BAA-2158]CCO79884.1 hypothetical protein BN432_3105 [Erwinia amylovora Ea356]CCO83690.1 hypothetical protein BN433_3133 [Erwinia amylovora Ea266]CCO87448.1 hypothetical protein BN434_3079 [Erwinia a
MFLRLGGDPSAKVMQGNTAVKLRRFKGKAAGFKRCGKGLNHPACL